MGSIIGNGWGREPKRRRGVLQRRRKVSLGLESLETRQLLTGELPAWRPTSSNLADLQNGPLAKAGQQLSNAYFDYQRYQTSGQIGNFANSPMNSQRSLVKFYRDSVAITAYGAGDFKTYVQTLQGFGLTLGGTSEANRMVEGLLPISQLPVVAQLTTTIGMRAQLYPVIDNQGSGNNQGEQALLADTAKQQFGVNGSGVTIGVISDSANKVGGGLATSVSTGDLPAKADGSPNVNVLQDSDFTTGDIDEGRAMLELVYDISPGSGLAFHAAATQAGGETVMAAGIKRLATEAKASVIVDDISFGFEPYYQDGVIAQAVTDVTNNNGVSYFTSAGNRGDHGIESPFRAVNGTVAGVGAGRFMDFDPSSAVSLTLPVTAVNAGATFILQYDQPFGLPNGVTSNVFVFAVDANGAVISGNQNNIASQQPYQSITLPTAGLYQVSIQVAPGSADVGRVALYQFGNALDVTFSQQFGSGGGITYPSTFGHKTTDAAIGVGAVPFFNAPFYDSRTPVMNETFSSTGPSVKTLNPDGTRKPAPQFQQVPVLSGIDGVNTSFFQSAADDIDTTAPPFGNPTPTNLDPDTLPNFFGTSAAAPNVAAVGALMKSLNPSASPAEVRAAMIASTIPLNGTPKNVWDKQGGFGLVRATEAMTQIDRLRVLATTPATGTTLNSGVQNIVVDFSRDIDAATLQPTDLTFTTFPPGVTVVVGQPVIADPRKPRQVTFPLTIMAAAGFKANGAYAYRIADGSVASVDKKGVVAFTGGFSISDQFAPTVVSTQYAGRFITIKFSEPMNPNTIIPANFALMRAGGDNDFGNGSIALNTDSRFRVSYDANNNAAIIDLSLFSQTQLPSDVYALGVVDAVTDVVGNRLDGETNPTAVVFPSGNGTEGGNFVEIRGFTLTAPQILSLALDTVPPTSDTGIVGDQNTRVTQPKFVGQVAAAFPGTASGLNVAVQFNALHANGIIDLGIGLDGTGYVGTSDINPLPVTDANGRFTFNAPQLTDGFHKLRVVVSGASDKANTLPGLSTLLDQAFRIDTTKPQITTTTPVVGDPSTLQQDDRISVLSSVVLDVIDPVQPSTPGNFLEVPKQLLLPALDPSTATNISNYTLVNLGSDNKIGGVGTAADTDFSRLIVSATFRAGVARAATTDPYTGQIQLFFKSGLPAGKYNLVAHTPSASFLGITDAAGNPLDADPSTPENDDFVLQFDYQPVPTYMTSMQAGRTDSSNVLDLQNPTGPRSFYEVFDLAQKNPRATKAPNTWFIDFSGPLLETNEDGTPRDYTGTVRIIRSADGAALTSDGDFGADPTFTRNVNYTDLENVSITLKNSVLGATFGQPGYKNRLVVTLQSGTELPPDQYRLYIENPTPLAGSRPSQNPRTIYDAFANATDLEFLGNLTSDGKTYENLLPTGQVRANDLTGDLVAGGSFETGFVVAPHDNILFARPDYVDDLLLPSDDSTGSPDRPFSTLAPEVSPTLLTDRNDPSNFDSRYDRNGNGRFDRSAFVAATDPKIVRPGPVVIIAQPSTNDLSKTFALRAPSGPSADFNDGSASVPRNTLLVFTPGSTLKMRNASLYVQNQGSAIQMLGGANPTQQVTITSYADDTAGGDTNRDGNDSRPAGGDWGGIVLRNFDDSAGRAPTVAPGPVADPNNAARGTSGADDAMSILNYANLRYGGGPVPQTIGYRFDTITLFNSRPAITNSIISDSGLSGSTQAAISGDVDSFREDPLTRGPLIRNTTTRRNSINGILIRAEVSGVAEPTNAVSYTRPGNNNNLNGPLNYTFDDSLPYVLLSRLVVGETFQIGQSGAVRDNSARLYFSPGSIVKFQRGAGIDVLAKNTERAPSIIAGDRTYVTQYDLNPNLSPQDPSFRPNNTGDQHVIFTSLFDDDAATAYVKALDSDNGGTANKIVIVPGSLPTDAFWRWGGIGIESGARAIIDEAEFNFGGGGLNTAFGTIDQRDALAFLPRGGARLNPYRVGDLVNNGTFVSITNSNFNGNLQAAMSIMPNGLPATDPLRPLLSGNPFFRGNVMQGNSMNGLEVVSQFVNRNGESWSGYIEDLSIDSVWDDTDLAYLVRNTIRLDGYNQFDRPFPNPGASLQAELKPAVVLTMQSSLPDTILADGSRIARPGESLIVKLLTDPTVPVLGDGTSGMPTSSATADSNAGAGFIVGVDDGVDPTADPYLDAGFFSQIRILGIGGNETTGQRRVPVILTSMRDDTVGTTVRGVPMFRALEGNTTAPAPGDGGAIVFGANSLSDYNLLDPRDGSLIDNADIKFMTRIEQQGGGWVYREFAMAQDRLGLSSLTQFNTAKAMTVSNSNLDSFSQVGFIAHDSGVGALNFTPDALFGPFPPAAPFNPRDPGRGQPTLTYFVNNSISNMPIGVRIVSQQVGAAGSPAPAEAIFLNNTFDRNAIGLSTTGFNATDTNRDHVYYLAMDNIFSNSSTVAIRSTQKVAGEGQYNLFSGNAQDVDNAAVIGFTNGDNTIVWRGFFNHQPVSGPPQYRDPTTGNYQLLSASAAIDAARSEIGPLPIGISLQPIADQKLNSTTGIRNRTGRTNAAGALLPPTLVAPRNVVSLPGYPLYGFESQWVAANPSSSDAVQGITSGSGEGGVFAYRPIDGERDQLGFLRQDDPTQVNVGFGSRPFFDLGAFEFRPLSPPHVDPIDPANGTNIIAILPNDDPTKPDVTVDIYKVGSPGGANKTPKSIIIQFNKRLDPATINNKTVLLETAGGDGIFGNNPALDTTIDLSGKLSFSPTTKQLTISLADSKLTLPNDLYRITILGNGENVVRDEDGNALDGEDTVGNTANGAQLPLPSGDGFPTGNFFLTFAIDTNAPSVVAGTLQLDPSTNTGATTDTITSNARPAFIGRITDIPPPQNPLINQQVLLDVSTKGDGVFDRMAAGTAITDAAGNFIVVVDPSQPPLPDSPYNVGPDGILGTADDTGYSIARIRVIDTSTNQSSLTDPNAMLKFVVDTRGPKVVSSSLQYGSLANPTAGALAVTLELDENIDPASVTAATITAARSGGDGTFGETNDVPITIDPTTIVLSNPTPFTGHQRLSFTLTGLTQTDIYQIVLSGVGSSIVADIAGNAIDGETNGQFPSGDGIAGGNFVLPFVIYNPATSRIIYASATGSATNATGSRANPYPTVTAALAVALPGDTVAVLAGVYNEQITLKSLVKVVSAGNSSTDTTVVPGLAQQTIIRAPQGTSGATVTGSDLLSIPTFTTELAGLTIASPLVGNLATGPINPNSIGIMLTDADVLIDKNYVINAQIGLSMTIGGPATRAPRILSNGFVGNVIGVAITETGGTTFQSRNIEISNDTFAYNTFGVMVTATTPGLNVATVSNSIFFQNADPANGRAGAGIIANSPNHVLPFFNLFQANGPNVNNPADDAVNVGNGFDPAKLKATPDLLGNITGNPNFVLPIDARPNVSGPGNFFLGANFDLKAGSAAIDNAINSLAPTLDFRSRGRVDIPRVGRFGPADIGAFEYNGTGGVGSGTAITSGIGANRGVPPIFRGRDGRNNPRGGRGGLFRPRVPKRNALGARSTDALVGVATPAGPNAKFAGRQVNANQNAATAAGNAARRRAKRRALLNTLHQPAGPRKLIRGNVHRPAHA